MPINLPRIPSFPAAPALPQVPARDHGVSARSVNVLGRHGIRTLKQARQANVLERLAGERILRNPAVLSRSLSGAEAVEFIEAYRYHPRRRLIGFLPESRPLHDTLWKKPLVKRSPFTIFMTSTARRR